MMSEPYSTTGTEQLKIIRDGLTKNIADPAYADEVNDLTARRERISAEIGRRSVPQKHCRNQADHQSHLWSLPFGTAPVGELTANCPGRHTPSAHRAPHPSPSVPADPFAGIDESTEFDATRPAVS
jgi:hypothetical protein